MMPNRTKFRKVCKGRIGRLETRSIDLRFGSYGLQVLERSRISARQLEAFRRVLSRRTKRMGQVWFRVFPQKPYTSKPLEVRMGKGKGSVDYWAADVRPGRVIVELDGIPESVAIDALQGARAKLPCTSRILRS
uniref:50S ribosomal protein L16 n=1 Tax=Hemiarma marina TaxID=1848298 RepID=A0A679EJZ1_9CRYP|nr:50S ribosomal protein L16 [Hemiarma marina]